MYFKALESRVTKIHSESCYRNCTARQGKANPGPAFNTLPSFIDPYTQSNRCCQGKAKVHRFENHMGSRSIMSRVPETEPGWSCVKPRQATDA